MDCTLIFLSFFAIVAEGLTEDFGGGGGASSSSSSLTSIDLDVTGFTLAFVMAWHRVSSTQASSLRNSVKEHFDMFGLAASWQLMRYCDPRAG